MIKHYQHFYVLDGKKPVPCHDIDEWGKFMMKHDRIVKQTHISKDVGVSTVFLGIDHGFGSGEPVLFETMIFGGEHDGYQQRYRTWEEAEKGHQRAIELIFEVDGMA